MVVAHPIRTRHSQKQKIRNMRPEREILKNAVFLFFLLKNLKKRFFSFFAFVPKKAHEIDLALVRGTLVMAFRAKLFQALKPRLMQFHSLSAVDNLDELACLFSDFAKKPLTCQVCYKHFKMNTHVCVYVWVYVCV